MKGRDNKFAILPHELKIICEYERKIKIINEKKKIFYGLQDVELDAYKIIEEDGKKLIYNLNTNKFG